MNNAMFKQPSGLEHVFPANPPPLVVFPKEANAIHGVEPHHKPRHFVPLFLFPFVSTTLAGVLYPMATQCAGFTACHYTHSNATTITQTN